MDESSSPYATPDGTLHLRHTVCCHYVDSFTDRLSRLVFQHITASKGATVLVLPHSPVK